MTVPLPAMIPKRLQSQAVQCAEIIQKLLLEREAESVGL